MMDKERTKEKMDALMRAVNREYGSNLVNLIENTKFAAHLTADELREQAERDTLYGLLVAYGIVFNYMPPDYDEEYPGDEWHDAVSENISSIIDDFTNAKKGARK